ncbi:hypothetical protein SLEP1_g47168 [Rubroshorea leprosula]|uniref:Uncharacterized protein n=1 Tax=Rubroshorea leprosula TaxID=152421 RepID=A0AAV5LPJ3_9ROSI|nr:hypothetical protein SLEP1_g47168 [Rubroshorea leprosula]
MFAFTRFRFTGETQPGLIACENAAKKLIDLGLVFTPVEDAVRETVESLRAKGFVGSIHYNLNLSLPHS